MGFGTLEDLEGSFELVIFSEPYASLPGAAALEAKESTDGAGDGPIPLLVIGHPRGRRAPQDPGARRLLKLEEAEEQLCRRAAGQGARARRRPATAWSRCARC